MNKKIKNILLGSNAHPELQSKLSAIVRDMEANENAGRTERFELRLTPAEKMQITAKAMKSGYSTSAYVRDVLLERIARIEMI